MQNLKISVIIPAHQEEQQIAETLESLTNQSYKNFEAIVVANGCTDNTVSISEQYYSRLPLSIIQSDTCGIGYACNLGAKNSNGDIIMILEADTTLPELGLQRIAEAVNNGFIGGTIKLSTKEDRIIYRILTKFLEWDNGAGWGPVRFATKKVYDGIQGHREGADYGVDCDFSMKVKQSGPTVYIKDITYMTSMRRFEKSKRDMLKQAKDYLLGRFLNKEFEKMDYDVIR